MFNSHVSLPEGILERTGRLWQFSVYGAKFSRTSFCVFWRTGQFDGQTTLETASIFLVDWESNGATTCNL